MYSLCIDTSNQPISVSLMKEGYVLNTHTSSIKRNHSVQLMPLIESLLKEADILPNALTDIIVAKGPGSYTGLRIGVTTAKTLAYTLNLNLYGVSSLKALAATTDQTDCWIVPIIDARRHYVYAGIYQWQNGELIAIMEDQYVALETLLKKLNQASKVVLVGRDVLQFDDLSHFDKKLNLPQAEKMDALKGEPVTIHSFVPEYLKLSEAEQNWLNQQQSNSN
ncbi:tRNA (adenosine(37)-N6)-threonylcarbamoyltransferase complex dimerization subunit type 1 TsaB [Staphylococcus felis]|uniref:tRNA (Adenosine(37)-N6)-threonylcarbamoyltransferase complex dimerization subunit type 1 TsaB n=1 Tax=Staphylococcus felis TaxID=46127 RepID=A0AAX1RUK7_9STAP|nr:tRNA (adenosine(37)-N6)-threonylcarbamoyltransferase complex dimerization subunit type 1 TsaB [Staphylococcus felis]MBH9580555.1 tRNA (adenosine(37)-N6)-threonylcarbamoyltransferase complex dimerization subunit type 1 TsaB [Staphylococcus felis]MDM8328018.1 tRNA (adenosine(37)-N6)-threonylcarbamoyltransferase complex dimerization subunit type 1 TsaB [Staphylococcus felis]MDQ7193120.1 tRNA (adenosine(37)-N6)-threonylcarbamoyltransferase complex dimerization subunit type 1 TsaB [Staphylococcus 